MKILLVGDDTEELDIIAYMLRREGYAVARTSALSSIARRLRAERPELVVASFASLSPVALEGFRAVRAVDATPLLAVTGSNDRALLLRCLEAGADDLLVRPYPVRELVLRVRAMLRRVGRRTDDVVPLRLGQLTLDPETHDIARGPFAAHLTPIEFRIMYVLAQNAERTVTSTRLVADVWAKGGADQTSLRSHICHLRRKLAPDAVAGTSIASVPGVGYVFHAPAPPP